MLYLLQKYMQAYLFGISQIKFAGAYHVTSCKKPSQENKHFDVRYRYRPNTLRLLRSTPTPRNGTADSWFNKVPRYWGSGFVISTFRYIVLFHTLFVTPRTSLYEDSSNPASTVHTHILFHLSRDYLKLVIEPFYEIQMWHAPKGKIVLPRR